MSEDEVTVRGETQGPSMLWPGAVAWGRVQGWAPMC